MRAGLGLGLLVWIASGGGGGSSALAIGFEEVLQDPSASLGLLIPAAPSCSVQGPDAGTPSPLCTDPVSTVCPRTTSLSPPSISEGSVDPSRSSKAVWQRAYSASQVELAIPDLSRWLLTEVPESRSEYARTVQEMNSMPRGNALAVAARARFAEASQRYRTAMGKYALVLGHVHRETVKLFEAQGITEGQLFNRINGIRDRVASRVRGNPAFPPLASERVSSVQMTTVAQLAPAEGQSMITLEQATALGRMVSQCGSDGLSVNAYYEASTHRMNFCPGYLLDAANSREGLESITFATGHELGHSIDPGVTGRELAGGTASWTSEQVGERDEAVFGSSYRLQTACTSQYASTGLGTLASEIRRVQEKISASESDVQRLESGAGGGKPDSGSADPLLKAKRRLNFRNGQLAQLRANLDRFNLIYPPQPNVVQTHSRELAGDYWGAKALEASLARTGSRAARTRMFVVNLQLFCGTGGLAVDQGDDGLHPSGRYRIEAVMRNPNIRKSLGCPAFRPGDRPWCTFEGPDPQRRDFKAP